MRNTSSRPQGRHGCPPPLLPAPFLPLLPVTLLLLSKSPVAAVAAAVAAVDRVLVQLPLSLMVAGTSPLGCSVPGTLRCSAG